jgi:hypothetical protein
MRVSRLQVRCDFLSPVATPYPFARCHGFLRVFYSDYYFIFYNCIFIIFIIIFSILYSSCEGTRTIFKFMSRICDSSHQVDQPLATTTTNHKQRRRRRRSLSHGGGKGKGPRDVVNDVSLVIGMFIFAFLLLTFTN